MAARAPAKPARRSKAERLELARRLRAAGTPARIVADTLDLPIGDVVRVKPSPDDAEDDLRDAVRTLGLRAIARAEHLLEFGAPAQQIAVMRALMYPLMASTRQKDGDDDRMKDLREQMSGLLEAVREPSRIVQAAVDPDEAGEDRAPGTKLDAARNPRRRRKAKSRR